MDPLWMWVCQPDGHIKLLNLPIEAMSLGSHCPLIFGLSVGGDGSMTPGPVILPYMDAVFLKVNVDAYHSTGLEELFFILLFFHHFELLPEHVLIEGDERRRLLHHRSFSLMTWGEPAFFFCFANTHINLLSFRAIKVALRLATLAIAYILRFVMPLLSSSVRSFQLAASSSSDPQGYYHRVGLL